VRGVILAGLAARSLTGWRVARSFQPRHQAAPSGPTVFLFKVGPDKRHGSPQEKDLWDDVAQVMNHTVSQQYETTLQASVLVDESTDPAALTPSDALSIVCDMIQTDEGRTVLQAAGVGILRVTEIRNTYDVNDRGQYAANPSFDFVLTYRRERTSSAPYVVSVDRSVNRV
jgi:hypothetical protein